MTTGKSTRKRKIPTLCLHRATKQAVVRLDGKDIYCGMYGTSDAQEKYERTIAEWLVTARTPSLPLSKATRPTSPNLSVNDLVLAYWRRQVTTYYVKKGVPTSEQDNIRQALRFVRRLYGSTAAATFGPLALKATRQAMIEAERCRSLINKDVGRICGMFKWAAANEILPVSIHQALATVTGLTKGRHPNVKEAEPVTPAPEAHVWAVHEIVSPQIQAMIELQWWTGMRPGEVVIMRADDIDRTGDVWVYSPESHKREHHELQRPISLGPKAQVVLAPWLNPARLNAYLFSPRESMAKRKLRPKIIKPGEHYRVSSYRNAIRRACARLAIPVWFPNQLRHNTGTRVRHRFGLEASRAVLGHETVVTTLIYAEKDQDEAKRIMREIG